MTTTNPAEAVITTLTAEVRTLVVGTRQVTLSVAKQLDMVPLGDLTVMGRVKIDRDAHHVIGTATDGGLAIAKYRPKLKIDRDTDLILRLESDDLPERPTVCSRQHHYVDANGNDFRTTSHSAGHYFKFTSGTDRGRSFLLNTTAAESCGVDHRQVPQACDTLGWTELGKICREALARQHLEHLLTVKAHQDAAAAPLIVLAGLK